MLDNVRHSPASGLMNPGPSSEDRGGEDVQKEIFDLPDEVEELLRNSSPPQGLMTFRNSKNAIAFFSPS
jgi:hypothetical protein